MAPEADRFLEERIERYDGWIEKNEIDFPSRVIPVRESLDARQWVLPREQVLEILHGAEVIGLTGCICRSHYRRCDNPVDVCLLLNSAARKDIRKGRAREVSVSEAEAVLVHADKHGLVHLSFVMPGSELYALCSCCGCCCHDLQILKRYGRSDLVARSDFVAETDAAVCSGCGECVDRCQFGARRIGKDIVVYNPDQCYGCGLCVTTCPTAATILVMSLPVEKTITRGKGKDQ